MWISTRDFMRAYIPGKLSAFFRPRPGFWWELSLYQQWLERSGWRRVWAIKSLWRYRTSPLRRVLIMRAEKYRSDLKKAHVDWKFRDERIGRQWVDKKREKGE